MEQESREPHPLQGPAYVDIGDHADPQPSPTLPEPEASSGCAATGNVAEEPRQHNNVEKAISNIRQWCVSYNAETSVFELAQEVPPDTKVSAEPQLHANVEITPQEPPQERDQHSTELLIEHSQSKQAPLKVEEEASGQTGEYIPGDHTGGRNEAEVEPKSHGIPSERPKAEEEKDDCEVVHPQESHRLNTTKQEQSVLQQPLLVGSPYQPAEQYMIAVHEPAKFVQFQQFPQQQGVLQEDKRAAAPVVYWQVFFMKTEFELTQREKYSNLEQVNYRIEIQRKRLEELNQLREGELDVPVVPVTDDHLIERMANSESLQNRGNSQAQEDLPQAIQRRQHETAERLNKTLLEEYEVELVNKAYDTDSDEEAKEMKMVKVQSQLELVEGNRMLSNNLTRIEHQVGGRVQKRPVDLNSTKDPAVVPGKRKNVKTEKEAEIAPEHKKSETTPKGGAVDDSGEQPKENKAVEVGQSAAAIPEPARGEPVEVDQNIAKEGPKEPSEAQKSSQFRQQVDISYPEGTAHAGRSKEANSAEAYQPVRNCLDDQQANMHHQQDSAKQQVASEHSVTETAGPAQQLPQQSNLIEAQRVQQLSKGQPIAEPEPAAGQFPQEQPSQLKPADRQKSQERRPSSSLQQHFDDAKRSVVEQQKVSSQPPTEEVAPELSANALPATGIEQKLEDAPVARGAVASEIAVPKIELPAPSQHPEDAEPRSATNRHSERSRKSRTSRASDVHRKAIGFRFASNILSVKVQAEQPPQTAEVRPRKQSGSNPKVELLQAMRAHETENKTERPRMDSQRDLRSPASERSIALKQANALPSREDSVNEIYLQQKRRLVQKEQSPPTLTHVDQHSQAKELFLPTQAAQPEVNIQTPPALLEHSPSNAGSTDKQIASESRTSILPAEAHMKLESATEYATRQQQEYPQPTPDKRAGEVDHSVQVSISQSDAKQHQPSQPVFDLVEKQAMKEEIKELKRTIQEIQKQFVDQQRKSRSTLIEKISPYNVDPYRNQSPVVEPSVEMSRTESIMEYCERNKPTIQYPDLSGIRADNESPAAYEQPATPTKLYWHSELRKPSDKIGKILHRKLSEKKSQEQHRSPEKGEEFRIRPFLYKIGSSQEPNESQLGSELKKKLSKEDLLHKINVNEHNFRRFVKTRSNMFTSDNKKVNQSTVVLGHERAAYEHDQISHLNQLPISSAIKTMRESTSMKALANPEQQMLNGMVGNPPRSPHRKPLPHDNSFLAEQKPSQANDEPIRAIQTMNNGKPTIYNAQPTKQAQQQNIGNISKIEDEPSQQIIEDANEKFFEFPNLPRIPSSSMSSEELIQLGRETFELFGVLIDDDTVLNIKKYRNCVYFNTLDKHILWHYTGKFYIGGWSTSGKSPEGEKSGEGMEFYPDKYLYEGEFKDGKRHGEGTMKSSYRDVYTGQWIRGLRHGHGILKEASGNSYEGEWSEGKKHGFGKEVIGGKDVYEGVFERGLKEGMGRQTFPNGDRYEGNYKANKFFGKGAYYWNDSSYYMGDFQKGARQGKGIWKSSLRGGDTYEGGYKNDKKSGEGKYTWENGVVYTGGFENDLRHGEGIIKDQRGNLHRAVWEYGVVKSKLYLEQERKLQDRKDKKSSLDSRKKAGKDGQEPLVKRRTSMYASSLAKIDESTHQLSRITSCLREPTYRDIQQPKLLVENL